MKKILVINNDFDTMSLLKNWLERKGYMVKYTGNRKEVGKLLEEFFPQLILVDVLQQEVIRDLNSNENISDTSILLMTGYTQRTVNPELIVHDTIEKPFDLSILAEKIENLISKSHEVKITNKL